MVHVQIEYIDDVVGFFFFKRLGRFMYTHMETTDEKIEIRVK